MLFRSRLLMTAAVLTALTIAPAADASVSDGISAYQAGNYSAALSDLRPTARAGDRDAQFYLGEAYERGRGVSQDFVEAHKWYNLAAASGRRGAADARDALAGRMTSNQIAEAQSAARSWEPERPAAERPSQPAPSFTVSNIQSLLNQQGYDAGPVDGAMGPRTRAAIREFQRAEGITVDGQPTRDVFNALVAARDGRSAPQPTETQPSAPRQLVADIQAALRERGYEVRLVNGQLDDATRSAIRAYERDAGRSVTGSPSDGLLESLSQRADTGGFGARLEREAIADVQAALEERGYDPGPADGVLNPRTRDAIREYERDAGMNESGRITNELLNRLEVDGEPPTAAQPDPEPEEPQWQTVLSDDFSDGNYTRNPTWEVLSGSFSVTQGTLVSDVAPRPAGQQSPEDLGRAIVRDLLGTALGEGPAASEARIVNRNRITNSFRLSADVGAANDGRFAFGPFQGSSAETGYRLSYAGGERPALELVRISSSGTSILESVSVPRLTDGQLERVTWERADDGTMTVTWGGNEIMSTRDRAFQNDFNGIVLQNLGGQIGLGRIEVDARG